MAFPAVTNITGSNPGPGSETLFDTVQSPVGNLWKMGVFNISLSPKTVAATTTSEQTFSATGIGLLTTDFVSVNLPTPQAGLFIAGARVSAADTLSITFGNTTNTASISPVTATYQVFVARIQPNWSAPASGNQIDW